MTATRPTLVLALTAVLLAACQTASPPPRAVAAPTSRELGRTSNVIVVAAQSGDTAASLAMAFDLAAGADLSKVGDVPSRDAAKKMGWKIKGCDI